ncbi:hypothetical protein LTR62_005821 [Meristemomyces frigidus]|uniref:Uncharacterized protein n=1 Tax=Meristemomyces frigidus TaxID=1508187 RepID=A0AAN7YQA1_9PEZI|nr:hypothetical protein LTR62_005821 [Meristemomyces frigidus]
MAQDWGVGWRERYGDQERAAVAPPATGLLSAAIIAEWGTWASFLANRDPKDVE